MTNKTIATISQSLLVLIFLMYFADIDIAYEEIYNFTAFNWLLFTTWASVRLYKSE